MARRKADAMGENISSDNITGIEVKLTRAQKYGSAPVEGSTFMPSDRELLEKVQNLNPEVQRLALEILSELLASQRTSSCSQVIVGESCP